MVYNAHLLPVVVLQAPSVLEMGAIGSLELLATIKLADGKGGSLPVLKILASSEDKMTLTHVGSEFQLIVL